MSQKSRGRPESDRRPQGDAPAAAASGPRRRDWPWLLGLWAAAATFLWPVLAGGKSFYFRDTLVYYMPQMQFTAAALSAGRVPGWCAGIGTGFPFQADPHSAVFYPLSLLMLGLPFPRSYDLFVAIHLPLLATFSFLLGRRWGLSAAAAATGAGLLMLGGHTISLTSLVILRAVTWLPLALLAFDRCLDAAAGARRIALAALALAMGAIGSDPQYPLFTAGLMALLPWLRPLPGRVPPALLARRFAAVCLLAFGLYGVQGAPLAQLYLNSVRHGGVSQAERSHYQTNPRQLLGTVLPVAFPDPADPDNGASFPNGQVPLLQDLYWGLPACVLALAGMGWLGRRPPSPSNPPSGTLAPLALSSALLIAFGLAMSLGDNTPVFGIVTTLAAPLAAFRYPSKYFVFAALALPWLAAAGVEGLARGEPGCVRWFKRASLAALLLGALSVPLLALRGPALADWYLMEMGARAATAGRDLARDLADGWIVRLAVPLAATLLLWLAGRGLRRGGPAPASLLAAAALATLLDTAIATGPSLAVAADRFVAEPPRTASLLRMLARGGPPPRFVAHPPAPGETASLLPTSYAKFWLGRDLMTQYRGLPHGCNPLMAGPALAIGSMTRFQDLCRQESEENWDRLAARAGAQFSLTFGVPAETAGAGRELAGRLGLLHVWRLADASPRAFVAKRAVPAAAGLPLPSSDAVMALPDRATYEPARDAQPIELQPVSASACEILSYGDEALSVRFDLRGKGLLVVLDQFYPGWVARVDGKPRPISRVAGLFRGVQVESGERLLQMSYEPADFRLGAAVSVAALLCVTALLAWPRRFRL